MSGDIVLGREGLGQYALGLAGVALGLDLGPVCAVLLLELASGGAIGEVDALLLRRELGREIGCHLLGPRQQRKRQNSKGKPQRAQARPPRGSWCVPQGRRLHRLRITTLVYQLFAAVSAALGCSAASLANCSSSS